MCRALRILTKGNENVCRTKRLATLERMPLTVISERSSKTDVWKAWFYPYVLDLESKGLRYWHKFKPDYFNGSVASHFDAIAVGAYFAVSRERERELYCAAEWCCIAFVRVGLNFFLQTGMRHSGKPSSLLVACLDGILYNEYDEIKSRCLFRWKPLQQI
jgi:hypothetical protein